MPNERRCVQIHASNFKLYFDGNSTMINYPPLPVSKQQLKFLKRIFRKVKKNITFGFQALKVETIFPFEVFQPFKYLFTGARVI